MKNSNIILIFYDITDRRSFEELNYRNQYINKVNKNEALIINIVVNKCDLYEYEEVSDEEGEKNLKLFIL